MKKALVVVLVVGLLGAGGYGVYHYFFANERGTGRASSDAENAVYVDQISTITGFGSGSGLIDRYGGEVKPQATLEVKLQNDRTIKECFVKEGDKVEEGQRLFVYETQEDEDKLAQAQIEIEKAEGDIEVAEKAIQNYEKDKANAATSDDQLLATTNILSEQNNIKSKEYEIKSKNLEMEKLRESIANATVTAEMAGIIQKISDSSGSDGYGSGGDSAYITILAAGDFRIKGKLNEQNRNQLEVGMPMLVHSRVDSSVTWKGTVSEINTSNTDEEDSGNAYYYSGMGSESGSSNYSFYVDLESSEGLMLGQHVYMELDAGQDEKKDGLWLEDYYIMHEEDKAYVWMANSSNLIEKHEIALGEYDEELMKYEVTDGLGAEDYIAYPTDLIEEGSPVIYNDFNENESMDDMSDEGMGDMDMGEMDGMDGMFAEDSMGMEGGADDADIFDPGSVIPGFDEEGVYDDSLDGFTDMDAVSEEVFGVDEEN